MGNTQVGDLVEIWANTGAPAGIGIVVGHEVQNSILGERRYANVSWVVCENSVTRHVSRFKECYLKVIS